MPRGPFQRLGKCGLLCVGLLSSVIGMGLIVDDLGISEVRGIRFHRPSKNWVAEVGYHRITRIGADGSVSTSRVRTTHYLGGQYRREEAEAKYAAIKAEWARCVADQRKVYDEENARLRRLNQRPLPRFKPVWPKTTTVRRAGPALAPRMSVV